MKRRDFLTVLLTSIGGLAAGSTLRGSWGKFHLEEATLAELSQALATGQVSSRWLTEGYLDRISRLDRRGPTLRAIITTNPDALTNATALDRERKSRGSRGPLHGIPILLKDNLDTGDRMATTAGSLALAGCRALQDAFVVGRLRNAGAVVLGKTNLSEWANIRSNHSSSGWSAVGGQTRNPYVLSRNPSGSSSGSAVAVAASLSAAAVGTETDGSIVSPSACCSLVGLKPTVGLVSRRGIVPISHSQDTAGPMARTVTDAAILLSAMTGEDPQDPATLLGQRRVQDYTQFLDRDGLRGVRLGVARQFFGSHPRVDRLLEKQLSILSQLGATLVDPVKFSSLHDFGEDEFEVLLFELKADLTAYLATRGDSVAVHSLADLIAFNEQHRSTEMPYFDQETFLRAEAKGSLTEPAYLRARARCLRLAREEGLEALLAQHQLNAFVAPTSGPPWLIDHVTGDHGTGGCSSLAAVAGTPHLTVPAGYVSDLPIGISFFGRSWSEPELLRYGYAFEQATRARRVPRFLSTDTGG